jgi:hypothetical protein
MDVAAHSPPAPRLEPGGGPQARDRRPRSRRLLAPLGAAGVALTKLKSLLILLPKLKLLSTSGSMLVSIGAYSLIWG